MQNLPHTDTELQPPKTTKLVPSSRAITLTSSPTPSSEKVIAALVTDHLYLAPRAVRSCRIIEGSWLFPDAEQEAAIGLWRAARKWNPERGTPFAPYGFLFARGAVKSFLRDADITRPDPETIYSGNYVEHSAIGCIDHARLHEAIGELPAPLAEAARSAARGENMNSASKRLGVPRETMRDRLTRATAILADRFRDNVQ